MERIRELRNEKGLSQAELGKILNIAQNTLSAYERGSRDPDTGTLTLIAKYFGVTTDYLLGHDTASEQSDNLTHEDDELAEYLEELKTRPEMRMLFSLSKGATKKDVEDAVKIIEVLRKRERE